MPERPVSRVSLVIPVYCGEETLPTLLAEIAPLTHAQATPNGRRFVICEVLLAHDCGPDRSDQAIEALRAQYPFVPPPWSAPYARAARVRPGRSPGSSPRNSP